MSKIDDGGPAFPTEVGPGENGGFQSGNERWHEPGMSLRDHFAGRALQGMLADLPKTLYGLDWAKNVAKASYEVADEMLKARQQ